MIRLLLAYLVQIHLLYNQERSMEHGRILLISNSTQHGRGYLDHVEAELRDFLGASRSVLFVPFALFDRPAYGAKAQSRLALMGFACDVLDTADAPEDAIERAEAFFVGGGNTFRLLKALQDSGAAAAIARRVRKGTPYIGSSAGSIVAGPSLKTTKDMPIVQPASFEALSLVEFQISPHYLDPDPSSTHMGETQQERILQFLEENDAPVLGLREGGFVRVEKGEVVVKGDCPARIFRRGAAPVEVEPGARLDSLLRRRSP
jgi:dipeptidase E